MKKFLLSVFVFILIAANALAVASFGLDTVAGFSTVLRTGEVEQGSEVTFRVTNPLGEVVEVSGVANDSGVVIETLDGAFTEVAGVYKVNGNEFEVFPGELSLERSSVTPLNQVVPASIGLGEVEVFVSDVYGNAIDDRVIKLIGKNEESLSAVSNERGVASFEIENNGSRLRTFRVFDALEERFFEEEVALVFDQAVGNSSNGLVDHLSFEDVPSRVDTGEVISLSVEAEDFANNTVGNYLGKVRFYIDGVNSEYANLPEDYRFTAENQGEHTFSLAFSFQQAGNYKLKVMDMDNSSIEGEVDILVTAPGNEVVNRGGFFLTSPVAGTYASTNQLVRGVAPAGQAVKIYDNDIEIGSVVADISGTFSYTANLADGSHDIYAAQVNSEGTIVAVSKVVRVSIDSEGVEIKEIVISPEEILPASAVTVRIKASDTLSRAYMIVNENQVDLALTSAGSYEGAFRAPVAFGDYALDFVLVDALGNESRLDSYRSFKVGTDMSEPRSTVLGNVSGLQAVAADERVVLSWNEVGTADRYRVYYGISPDLLTEAVDTLTDAATWYVPNLINGSDYYFAVVALDLEGNSSGNLSNIVSARPKPSVFETPVEESDISNITGGSEVAKDALKEIEGEVSDVGPEVLWLLILSLLAGNCYILIKE